VEARDAVVDVLAQPGGRTRVKVRIGTFRTDETRRRAALILERVVDRLE
jgi:hypothetical protein